MSLIGQIIVGYTYATDPSWQSVLDNAKGITHVILNPGNGAGKTFDANYLKLRETLAAAGIKVVGYVYSGTGPYSARLYGTRPMDEIRNEFQKWVDWYKVDGFFIDETASDATKLVYYNRVKLIAGGRPIILNHGTFPDPGYADIGDILCVAETDEATYLAKQWPAWMTTKPESKFYHIVYGVKNSDRVLAAIQANHVGYYYMASVPGPDPQFSVGTTIFRPPPTQTPGVGSLTNDQLIDELRRRLQAVQ